MRWLKGRAKRWPVWGDVLRRTVAASLEHDALTVAQATAYLAMVSLFPVLIVVAAGLSVLPEAHLLRGQLAPFFERVLPPAVMTLLDSYFKTGPVGTYLSPGRGGALLSALLVSVTGATSVMATLMEGFRRAHELPLLKGSFWPRRWRALVLVPLSLVPMTVASVLVMFGHLLTRWAVAAVTPELAGTVRVVAFGLRWGVALAGSGGILAVIYHLGTDLTTDLREHLEPLASLSMLREPWAMLRREWTWKASLPGAALATGLWFVSTLVFGAYVTRFANYSRVYGSLGAGIALMVWLYLIAMSVILGAEFNAQLMKGRRDPEAMALLWKVTGLWQRRTGRMAD